MNKDFIDGIWFSIFVAGIIVGLIFNDIAPVIINSIALVVLTYKRNHQYHRDKYFHELATKELKKLRNSTTHKQDNPNDHS